MTRAEKYEEMDKSMSKESDPTDKKEDPTEGRHPRKEQSSKGGEGFVCSLECKKCVAS